MGGKLLSKNENQILMCFGKYLQSCSSNWGLYHEISLKSIFERDFCFSFIRIHMKLQIFMHV